MEEAANAVDWWARGIGVAALVLALLGLAWNVYNSVHRDRAHLKVGNKIAIIGGGIGGEPLRCLCVKVSNTGRRPITLSGCVVDVGSNQSMTFFPGAVVKYGPLGIHIDESHKMPKRLEEGESHEFLFLVDGLRDGLAQDAKFKPIASVVKDGTGKPWRATFDSHLKKFIAGTKG